MFKINADVNLESVQMDISPPTETSNPLDTDKENTEQEENMTLLPSSIDQEPLQTNREGSLSAIPEQIIEHEDEENPTTIDYWTLSDEDMKGRLLKAMKNEVHLRNQIQRWLETDVTSLPLVREHASLLAKYSSLKMDLELYQVYIHMTQSTLGWLSGMSKTLLERININDGLFKIQKNIKKQLKDIEEQFENIKQKLAKSSQCEKQRTTSSKVDVHWVKSLIVMLVREDQQQFDDQYLKKRHLLMLNAKDIRLVHEFHHLQPSIRQVFLAECIWQATIDAQRRKTNTTANQRNVLTVADYEHIIDDHKKFFLTSNQVEEGATSLSLNYSKLNIDLLMDMIESRQKTLLQRMEFDDDFKQTFPIDDDGDDHDDSDEEPGNTDDNDQRYWNNRATRT